MTRRIVIAAIALSTAAALPALAETRTYDVASFDGIDVSAGIEVIFETGTTKSVSVENKDGDFSDIIVESKGGELVLKRPRKMDWGRKPHPAPASPAKVSLAHAPTSRCPQAQTSRSAASMPKP